MRRMQRGLMAAHESQQAALEAEDLALEGWKGAAGGVVAGIIGGMFPGLNGVYGAMAKQEVLKKRKEIQELAKEIAKVAADNGKKAVEEGKISAEDYKTKVDIGWEGVVGGFFGGFFFGPIYLAIRGSQMEDLHNELKAKMAELQELLKKAKKEHKAALESFLVDEAVEGQVALEGIKGGVMGFLAGTVAAFIPGANSGIGIALKREVLRKREEIQELAKEMAKVAADNGKKAVEEGKLDAEDYKKQVNIGWKGIIGGFFGGGFFGPFYHMVRSSQLEDLHKELEAKVKELQRMLDKAAAPATESMPVEDHSQSAETDLIAIADHEAEASAAHHDMDQAADVACALEAMSLAMRTASENGGLSRDGARVAHVAADSLCKSIGLQSVLKSMPSLESYGSVGSRVMATNLALEDLAEKAKLIWAKIVEAIKKSLAWIKERFALMFSVAGKLKSRAEGLAKAAESVEGEAEESEIDNARLFGALSIDGKIDGLISGMEYVAGHAAEVYSGAEHRMEALLAATEAKAEGDMFKALAGLSQVSTSGGEVTSEEGKTVWKSQTLPGGKALVVTLPSEDQLSGNLTDVARAITSSSASVRDVAEQSEGKLPVLSPADAAKLATVCAKAAASVFEFEQTLKKISDLKAKATSNAEAMSNAQGDSEEANLSRAMGPVFMAMGKLVDNPVAGFSAYILNTVKASLDYVAASIKRPGLVSNAAAAVGDAADATVAGAKKAAGAATIAGAAAADATKDAAGKAGAAVKAGADKVGAAVKETAGKVGDAAKAAADKLKPKAA